VLVGSELFGTKLLALFTAPRTHRPLVYPESPFLCPSPVMGAKGRCFASSGPINHLEKGGED